MRRHWRLEGVSSVPWFGKLYLPIIADIAAESPWLNQVPLRPCIGPGGNGADHPNRVRTLFTSVGNEADRVGLTQPIGLTHVGSLALKTHFYALCGSGCRSSGYFPNTVEFIPHQGKGCLDEGCPPDLLYYL
jgi:hypothetical protein